MINAIKNFFVGEPAKKQLTVSGVLAKFTDTLNELEQVEQTQANAVAIHQAKVAEHEKAMFAADDEKKRAGIVKNKISALLSAEA